MLLHHTVAALGVVGVWRGTDGGDVLDVVSATAGARVRSLGASGACGRACAAHTR